GCAPQPPRPPFPPPAAFPGTSRNRRPTQSSSPESPPPRHPPYASLRHTADDPRPLAPQSRPAHPQYAFPAPDQTSRTSKKSVVRRLLAPMPVAHRPRIHQLVIKNLILIGAPHRRFIFIRLARVARSMHQLRRAAIHAKSVLRRPINHALRINRPAQVDMQITPLRHLLQKRQQQSRLMPHRFHIFASLLFRILRHRDRHQRNNARPTSQYRNSHVSHEALQLLRPRIVVDSPPRHLPSV